VKLYRIRDWSDHFENNRSKTVVSLSWVAIPNRHDGENYSSIVTHEDGAKIFSAWILMLQVASKCDPRGTLIRDNKTPHTPLSLSLKTRAPQEWFEIALDFLVSNTDWLEYEELAGDCQPTVRQLTPECASRARAEWNGKEGMERKEVESCAVAPPPEKTTKEAKNSEHQKFIDFWCRAFQDRFGLPYAFAGGKDGMAVKSLLSMKIHPNQLIEIARRAWAKTDGRLYWACCNQSQTLAGFNGALNKINAELAKDGGGGPSISTDSLPDIYEIDGHKWAMNGPGPQRSDFGPGEEGDGNFSGFTKAFAHRKEKWLNARK